MQEVAEQLGIQPESGIQPERRFKEPEISGANFQDLKNAKTYFGILKDFGGAPYQNDPKNEPSYYATLVFKSGVVRTLWGVDLERAITKCEAKLGEHVTLANLGREPVIVTVAKKDKNGVVVGQTEIESFRNTWSVIRSGATKAQTKAQATVEARADQAEIALTVPARVSGSDLVSTVQTSNHISMRKPGTQESAKVLPFSKVQPQWLLDAQKRAKANLERKRQMRDKAAEKIMKVWNESVPFQIAFQSGYAEPMRRYFQNRNILFRIPGAECQDSLRFHGALPYYDDDNKFVGNLPAIVCAIRRVNGELVTLHRIYITHAGKKAPVGTARKMMSIPEGMEVKGAAIQLGIPKGVLGVGEGLETALSAYRATQIPTWPTVNAMLMGFLEVPESVHTVLIWADKDKSGTGERSAAVLQSKLIARGLKAYVLMPPIPRGHNVKSIDWNDVLCGQGLLGFPSVRHLL